MKDGKSHINLPRLNEICALLGTNESYILNGVSNNSSFYLNSEIYSLLKDCSASDKELIYKIVDVIKSK